MSPLLPSLAPQTRSHSPEPAHPRAQVDVPAVRLGCASSSLSSYSLRFTVSPRLSKRLWPRVTSINRRTAVLPAGGTGMPDGSSIASHLSSLPMIRWIGVLDQLASRLPDVDVSLAECVEDPGDALFAILEKFQEHTDANRRRLPPDIGELFTGPGQVSIPVAYELESLTQVSEGNFGFTRILTSWTEGEDVRPYPNVTSIENPRWAHIGDYKDAYNALHPPPWAPEWRPCSQHSSGQVERSRAHSQGRIWQFSQPRAVGYDGGVISSSDLPQAIAEAVSNLGMTGSVLMGGPGHCAYGGRGFCLGGSCRTEEGLCRECCPDCRFPTPDIPTLKRMLPEEAWPHVREHVAKWRRAEDRWYASPIPPRAAESQ